MFFNQYNKMPQKPCDCINEKNEKFDLDETMDLVERQHLARATVPFQVLSKMYSPEESLAKGTVFPELYQPYCPQKERK